MGRFKPERGKPRFSEGPLYLKDAATSLIQRAGRDAGRAPDRTAEANVK